MLSAPAREFKTSYINYCIMEALTTTSPEDRQETIEGITAEMEALPFLTIVDMAIADGLISSLDEVYEGATND